MHLQEPNPRPRSMNFEGAVMGCLHEHTPLQDQQVRAEYAEDSPARAL